MMKPRHRLTTTCLCVDSKNELAYSGSKDGTLNMWNLKTNKLDLKICGIGTRKSIEADKELKTSNHHRNINCIALSSDDKYLVTGGYDKMIRVWDPKTLYLINTLSGHRGEITALAFRKNHLHLYSASKDKSIKRWSLEEEENMVCIESLFGHEAEVTSIDALRKERILSSGRDLSIRLFKIVDGAQSVFVCKSHVEVVRLIDDRAFISGDEHGTISIWTTTKRDPVCSINDAHKLDDNNFSILSETVVGLNTKKELNKFPILSLDTFIQPSDNPIKESSECDNNQSDRSEHSESSDIESEEKEDVIIKNCTMLLASGSFDSFLRIWKITIKGSKYAISLHKSIDCPGFINGIRFSRDGTRIIVAVGQEHIHGRWWKAKGVKNCIKNFTIEDSESNATLKRKISNKRAKMLKKIKQ